MYKKIFLIFMIIFSTVAVYTEILVTPFIKKNIDIEYIISDNLEEIKLKQDIRRFFDKTLISKDKKYEIRYITYGYDKNIKIDEYIYSAYAVFARTILLNIAEGESNIQSAHNYNDADVNLEFNANKGITSFINGEGTYTEGYRYIMINFFFNINYGIVAQMVLFNDIHDIENNRFNKDFHSFRFKS